jgi:hypothetical protein
VDFLVKIRVLYLIFSCSLIVLLLITYFIDTSCRREEATLFFFSFHCSKKGVQHFQARGIAPIFLCMIAIASIEENNIKSPNVLSKHLLYYVELPPLKLNTRHKILWGIAQLVRF